MRKKQGKDEETHHDHAHGGVLHHTAETLEGAHLSLEAFELAAMTPARALTVIEKMIENARLVRLTSISEALQEIKTLVNDSKSLVHHGHSFFKVAGPAIVFVNTPIEIASILQQRSNHSSPEENDVITDKTYSVFGENLLRFGMLIPGNQWLLLLNGLDDLLVKPIRGETFKATLSKRWYHKIKEHAELRRIADKLLDDGVRESEDQVIFIDENDFRLKSAVSPVNLGVINDRLRRDQHIVVRKSSGDYVTGIKSRDRWHDVYFNQQRSKEPQGLDFSSEVSIVTDDDALMIQPSDNLPIMPALDLQMTGKNPVVRLTNSDIPLNPKITGASLELGDRPFSPGETIIFLSEDSESAESLEEESSDDHQSNTYVVRKKSYLDRKAEQGEQNKRVLIALLEQGGFPKLSSSLEKKRHSRAKNKVKEYVIAGYKASDLQAESEAARIRKDNYATFRNHHMVNGIYTGSSKRNEQEQKQEIDRSVYDTSAARMSSLENEQFRRDTGALKAAIAYEKEKIKGFEDKAEEHITYAERAKARQKAGRKKLRLPFFQSNSDKISHNTQKSQIACSQAEAHRKRLAELERLQDISQDPIAEAFPQGVNSKAVPGDSDALHNDSQNISMGNLTNEEVIDSDDRNNQVAEAVSASDKAISDDDSNALQDDSQDIDLEAERVEVVLDSDDRSGQVAEAVSASDKAILDDDSKVIPADSNTRQDDCQNVDLEAENVEVVLNSDDKHREITEAIMATGAIEISCDLTIKHIDVMVRSSIKIAENSTRLLAGSCNPQMLFGGYQQLEMQMNQRLQPDFEMSVGLGIIADDSIDALDFRRARQSRLSEIRGSQRQRFYAADTLQDEDPANLFLQTMQGI